MCLWQFAQQVNPVISVSFLALSLDNGWSILHNHTDSIQLFGQRKQPGNNIQSMLIILILCILSRLQRFVLAEVDKI